MAGELLGEIIGEGIVSLTGSDNKKERRFGCLFILLVTGLIIVGLIWLGIHTVTQSVIVLNKLSDNQIEYRELDSNVKGIEEISSETYDNIKINDTIQIKLVK